MTRDSRPDVDTRLDLSGLQCPLPVLKTSKAMQSMAVGQVVEVLSTDPMARIDIPHFCTERGHALLAQDALDEDEGTVFVIRKGGKQAAPA